MSGLISSLLTLGPVFILEDYHQSSSEEKEREPFTEHPPHAKSHSRCFVLWLRKYSSLSIPLALVASSLMSVLHPWVLTELTYPSMSFDMSLLWKFSKLVKFSSNRTHLNIALFTTYLPLVHHMLSLILLLKCTSQKFWVNVDSPLPFTWDHCHHLVKPPSCPTCCPCFHSCPALYNSFSKHQPVIFLKQIRSWHSPS